MGVCRTAPATPNLLITWDEEKKGNDDDAEEPGAQKIKSSICELDAHKSKELKKKGIDLAKLGGISDAI